MSYKQKDDYDMIFGWSIDRAIEVRKLNSGIGVACTIDDIMSDAQKLIDKAKTFKLSDEETNEGENGQSH